MNLIYALYFSLPNFAHLGFLGKGINRLLGIILNRVMDLFMPRYLKRTATKAGYGLNTEIRDETYIVSLTSFPARIEYIWITIETLLRQSCKPDKIILWLAKEQFSGKKLPESLTILKARGLSIEFCEDLRSHKKYFFSMQRFLKENVITVDDDVYYPRHFLKHLVNLHQTFPKAICANRAHKMVLEDGKFKPYRKWKHNYKKIVEPSLLLIQVGVGGVLYPIKSLSEEVFDREVFKKKCFYADDIWLKIMALKKGTAVVTNRKYNKDFVSVGKTQKHKLVTKNVLAGGNDEQLRDLLNYYRMNLPEILKDA